MSRYRARGECEVGEILGWENVRNSRLIQTIDFKVDPMGRCEANPRTKESVNFQRNPKLG